MTEAKLLRWITWRKHTWYQLSNCSPIVRLDYSGLSEYCFRMGWRREPIKVNFFYQKSSSLSLWLTKVRSSYNSHTTCSRSQIRKFKDEILGKSNYNNVIELKHVKNCLFSRSALMYRTSYVVNTIDTKNLWWNLLCCSTHVEMKNPITKVLNSYKKSIFF